MEYSSNVALFTWAGDRAADTLLVQLRDRDLPVARDGVALVVSDVSGDTVLSHLRALAAEGPADAARLAATVANKMVEKYHQFLNDELLSVDHGSCLLDPDGAWSTAVRLVAQGHTPV